MSSITFSQKLFDSPKISTNDHVAFVPPPPPSAPVLIPVGIAVFLTESGYVIYNKVSGQDQRALATASRQQSQLLASRFINSDFKLKVNHSNGALVSVQEKTGQKRVLFTVGSNGVLVPQPAYKEYATRLNNFEKVAALWQKGMSAGQYNKLMEIVTKSGLGGELATRMIKFPNIETIKIGLGILGAGLTGKDPQTAVRQAAKNNGINLPATGGNDNVPPNPPKTPKVGTCDENPEDFLRSSTERKDIAETIDNNPRLDLQRSYRLSQAVNFSNGYVDAGGISLPPLGGSIEARIQISNGKVKVGSKYGSVSILHADCTVTKVPNTNPMEHNITLKKGDIVKMSGPSGSSTESIHFRIPDRFFP
jgi:hypothetical protein